MLASHAYNVSHMLLCGSRAFNYIQSLSHLLIHTVTVVVSNSLFAWLISHQPAVLYSQNKLAINNQPAVLFSQNKPAPAISHQPTEQAVR
jgi:hypothetical protein